MADPVVQVENLRTFLDTPEGRVRAVDGVSLALERGRTMALLGESGCGKSMTALSLMRLVPAPAGFIAGGSVRLEGVDLLDLSEMEMRAIRGRRMAMIFQEPMTSLNPVKSVGEQIGEVLRRHHRLRGRRARERSIELLREVGIADPQERVDVYPHQLSGGMKQRVMIAMALAGEPEVLIADEPTTALDVTIQAQILALLARLQKERGMALLLITHDLAVVSQVADRVAVMYAGEIVEEASRDELFSTPRHPYTRKLFESLPARGRRDRLLSVIPGSVPPLTREFAACRFAPRCPFAWDDCHRVAPVWDRVGDGGVRCHMFDPRFADRRPNTPPAQQDSDAGDRHPSASDAGRPLLAIDDLKVHFPIRRGVFKRTIGHVRAVDGVSLALERGRTLALVGESGCGKTTLGRAVLQLIRPTAGGVRFDDLDLARLRGRKLRRYRRQLQMIFQDPFSSMDPRMRVVDVVAEGLRAQGLGGNTRERTERIVALLEQVGIGPEALERYPHEFSGGQRQRICIARALAVEPRLIICDEPTSALDVSVQAQVLNLLRRLQGELGLTYLFISHNMAVVGYVADEIAVMYLGRIVEYGSADEVLNHPKHPYTQALLAAAPTLEDTEGGPSGGASGDPPSPARPPPGCHFAPRCPHVMDVCRKSYPGETPLGPKHSVRCYLYGDGGIHHERRD